MPSRRSPPPAETQARSGDRIAKLLARSGVASRREVERMIAEGRIARDGVAIDTPNTVLSSLRGVTVDGKPVAAPAPARLFVYHKPVGLLVTERDPRGRPTIYDRLPPDLPRVVPVGRLDLNTEGLLLLTTDGGLKRQLELPATGVERTYRARAYGEVSQAQLEELIEGVEIDGVRYGQIDANLERRTGANVWIEMTLTEGKNREVRRVLEYLGLQVGRLIRVRYGPFLLGDLPPGEVGEIRQHDLVAFRQSLAGKRGGTTDPIAAAPLRQPRRAEAEPVEAESMGQRSDERRPAGPRRPSRPAKANQNNRSADTPPGPARARAKPSTGQEDQTRRPRGSTAARPNAALRRRERDDDSPGGSALPRSRAGQPPVRGPGQNRGLAEDRPRSGGKLSTADRQGKATSAPRPRRPGKPTTTPPRSPRDGKPRGR